VSNSETGEEEWPEGAAPPAPTRELAELQEMLLEAVLGRGVLPGSRRPIVLPDLDFVVQENEDVVISDENLLGEGAAGGQVRVLSVEEIRQEAERRGQLGYLRFQPAEVEGHSVRFTLEGRIARSGADDAGLSGVQTTFALSGGEWRLEEEPAYFAA
jgi:hypothetical protein